MPASPKRLRALLVRAALIGARAWGDLRMRSSFRPVEERGYTIVEVPTPPGSATGRALDVDRRIGAHVARERGVDNPTVLLARGLLARETRIIGTRPSGAGSRGRAAA